MENKVLEILKKVLGLLEIDTTCSQLTCDEWDSIRHLNIIIELQMEFDVSFEPEEIAEIHSYEDIIKVLKSKL